MPPNTHRSPLPQGEGARSAHRPLVCTGPHPNPLPQGEGARLVQRPLHCRPRAYANNRPIREKPLPLRGPGGGGKGVRNQIDAFWDNLWDGESIPSRSGLRQTALRLLVSTVVAGDFPSRAPKRFHHSLGDPFLKMESCSVTSPARPPPPNSPA